MTRYGLVSLLLGVLAWGQATGSKPASTPPKTATPAAAGQKSETPGKPGENPATEAPNIPPDAPVVTINGMCGHPPADKSAASSCNIVITRAEFEKLIDAVQPSMPQRVRRQFATRYANALVMAEKAEQMGLDKNESYVEHMKLARVQVLSQELNKALQEKAGQISDKEIEDYFHNNASKFEEADMERIYIPKVKQPSAADTKLSDEEQQKRTTESEEAMKAEADKLHARAVAGEDFGKLESDAFQAAGITGGSPSALMGKVRRTTLPPNQVAVMDLKAGDISPLITDQNGYFIYKIKSKDNLTLDQVREEIRNTIRAQRMQDSLKAMQESATPTLNEAYFAVAPPTPVPPRPGLGTKPKTSDPDD